jgi:hypothetical protein
MDNPGKSDQEEEDDEEEEEDEDGGDTGVHGTKHDEYMGEDFDLESENFKEGYAALYLINEILIVQLYRLEVLRKRKRWAQKEAEIRNLAKEQERKKADSDAKGKAKNPNTKVEQVSQHLTYF